MNIPRKSFNIFPGTTSVYEEEVQSFHRYHYGYKNFILNRIKEETGHDTHSQVRHKLQWNIEYYFTL